MEDPLEHQEYGLNKWYFLAMQNLAFKQQLYPNIRKIIYLGSLLVSDQDQKLNLDFLITILVV